MTSRPLLPLPARDRGRRLIRPLGAVLCVALVAALLPAAAPLYPAPPGAPGAPGSGEPVRGWAGPVAPRGDDPAKAAAVLGRPPVRWPAPGTARVDLTGGTSRLGG